MKPGKYLFTAVILSLFSGLPYRAGAQGLKDETAFFKSRQTLYQEWLDLTGLGRLLKVRDITADEQQVNLYLEIPGPYSDRERHADYVKSAWEQLRLEFGKNNALGLESQLLLKMLHILELEPGQATVQLYDTYAPEIKPYVFTGIYYDQEKKRIRDTIMVMKATWHSVPVVIPGLTGGAHAGADIAKPHPGRNDAVFKQIRDFIRRRYNSPGAGLAEPVIDVENGIYTLSLKPLYKEVLKDQQNQFLCQWLNRLGFDCNTLKQEWLTFTFKVVPKSFGYQLDCQLEGKMAEKNSAFGARGAFRVIDHDPDSRRILQEYGDGLMGELRTFLKN